MEELLDDVLLKVMQFLDKTSVFACRLVCRRFADLALHPDVWRHRKLELKFLLNAPWVCAVLRLAPCLREIDTSFCRSKEYHGLYTTKCAAAELNFGIVDRDVNAVLAIRNQEALGRLRSIKVSLQDLQVPWTKEPVLPRLLWTLASVSGLKELHIKNACFITPLVFHGAVPTPSLIRFRCSFGQPLEAFVNFVIGGHSATLEEVELVYFEVFESDSLLSLLPLLAGVPNLRRLACPLLPGMQTLAAVGSLRILWLNVKHHTKPALLSAAELLRRATQLRRVHLVYHGYDDGAVNLVSALASCGQSQVEYLSVTVYKHPNVSRLSQRPVIQPLVRALDSLPALRHLQLDSAPDDLLQAITPATAPALRTLELSTLERTIDCVHRWLHSDVVRTVLSLNPLLHIKLQMNYQDCEIYDCQTCSLKCHRVWYYFSYVCIFSHDLKEKCSLDFHNKDEYTLWISSSSL